MKEKRGKTKLLEILNSKPKPFIRSLILIIFFLAIVVAGDVIVKEGAMTIGDDFNASGILFVDSSSGRVGIGTDSPGHLLHLQTAASNQDLLRLQSTSNTVNTVGINAYLQDAANEPEYFGQIRFRNVDRTVGSEDGAIEFVVRQAGWWTGIMTIQSKDVFLTQGSLKLGERASALADTTAYGQLWVKTATPNQLWFTDDAGTDFQIGGFSKIFVQPGTGFFDGVVTYSYYYVLNKFEDGMIDTWDLNVQVPTGATGLTSIKIYYVGASAENLYLQFRTSRWDTDTAGTAVSTDLIDFTTYAGQAGVGTGILTIPSTTYDGLASFDEGDIFGLRISRNAGSAYDSYNAHWDVLGVEFVFS